MGLKNHGLSFCFKLKTRAAFTPLYVRLMDLRQDRACVRISKPCPDHAQQDVGHGCGFCFLDLCRVFIYDGFFIIPKP